MDYEKVEVTWKVLKRLSALSAMSADRQATGRAD